MLLNERTLDLTTGGLTENQTFKIKTTSKAFSILSDKLYSDKVSAVIRELCCNAYDSMVQAKNQDSPFSIHLPNSFEPWFSVSDTGVGLCHDDVMTLYTTYFDSTKNGSNSFIGALGLGSKSPFSIVDSFTVESTFNGITTSYTAYLNQDRLPTIAKLGETDTVNPNGLTVKIPVNKNLFFEFTEKSKKILRFFNPYPIIEGNSNFKPLEKNNIISGFNWSIIEYNTSTHQYLQNSEAIMGNVSYPIRAQNISSEHGLKTLLDANIRFYFDIGDLDIAPSREELSYDERTKKILLERISNFRVELSKSICEKISIADNEYKARILFYEIYNRIPYYGIMDNILQKNLINYNGIIINSCSKNINLTTFPNISIFNYTSHKKRPISLYDHSNVSFEYNPNCKIYWNDLKKGAPSRIINALKYKGADITLINYVNTADVDKISNILGGYPILPVSELEKPAPVHRVPVHPYYEYNHSLQYWSSSSLKIEDEDTGYWVEYLKNKDVRYVSESGEKIFSYSQFNNIIKHSVSAKIIDENYKIIGIRTGLKKFNKENPTWTNLFDVINDNLLSHQVKEPDFDFYSEMAEFNSAYYDRYRYLIDYITKEVSLHRLSNDSQFNKFILENEKIKKIIKEAKLAEPTFKLKEILGKLSSSKKRDNCLKLQFDELLNYYELLSTYTSQYYSRSEEKELKKYLTYILMVDKLKGDCK